MSKTSVSSLLESGSVIPYSQPEIEGVMRKILYEKGITDVMYEGSNISQLTSVISYVIGSMNINTAINIQEAILPLASKRMNVLFGARQLGYEPHKKKAFKYKITLTPMYDSSKIIQGPTNPDGSPGKWIIDTEDQTPRDIKLEQNTRFIANNKTYYYKGPTIDKFWTVSNWDIQHKVNHPYLPEDYFYKEIEIVEGTLITPEDDPSLTWVIRDYEDQDGYLKPQQDHLIPIRDIEEDGLQVFVESTDFSQPPVSGVYPTTVTQRFKSPHFLIDETFTQDENLFVRMENIILQYPAIFFQYSGMGNPVKTGDIIRVNAFKTLGADGAIEGDLLVDSVGASQNFRITKIKLLEEGTSEEDSDEIKDNATIFNNTANRAVTSLDYKAVLKSTKWVKDGVAWGGEDELPRQKGHIWFSTVPDSKFSWTYRKKDEKHEIDGVQVPDDKPKYERYLLDHLKVLRNPTELYNWYQSTNSGYAGDPANPVIPEFPLGNDEVLADSVSDIKDVVDYYKIMTMELHHRHPLYIDFDFYVDVVKYDMTKTKQEINKAVFEGIAYYFTNDLNNFDVDYLNSNLQRLLDMILGFKSGIGYRVETRGVLFREMKDKHDPIAVCYVDGNNQAHADTVLDGKINVSLDFPFESMYYKEGPKINRLNTDLLPRIDTLEFGNGKAKLGVDYSVFGFGKSQEITESDEYKETDIWYEQPQSGVRTIVGTYRVNNRKREIELVFNFENNQDIQNLEDEIFKTTIQDSAGNNVDIETYAYFDIRYPFTDEYNVNMPFSGHSKPRLRNVYFEDN